jgi:perosamine synthetase
LSIEARKKSFNWRKLPPAGGVASLYDIVKGLGRAKQSTAIPENLRICLAHEFGCGVCLTHSGKHALKLIFSLLPPEITTVITPAYGCPDVAAAAVRAGKMVALADIDERTLEVRPAALAAEIKPAACCAVLLNLYGLIDAQIWRSVSAAMVVVDDACQAALSIDGDRRVGFRTGLGVVSFGRGKALGGVGGGAALLQKQTPEAELPRGWRIADLGHAINWAAMSLCEHPALYRLPSSLPFLGIGATEYERNFNVGPLACFQALHALVQLAHLNETAEARRRITASWTATLKNLPLDLPVVNRGAGQQLAALTRYPVLAQDREGKSRIVSALEHEGLGVSSSYPESLDQLCRGEHGFINIECPAARQTAQRIFTLPTHRYVTEGDIVRATEIISAVLGGRWF